MKPRTPITDPAFRYTCAAKTDIRKTFARVRKEMREKQESKVQDNNILPLIGRK
jgi:glutamate formiminotransferase